MKAKYAHALSVWLAVQCGLWVTFAPVLSQMHQAVADHHHVFCPEHNRIEDEGLRMNAPSTAPEVVDVRPENRIGGCTCSATGGGAGIECAFSNFSVHVHSKASGQVVGRHLAEALALHPILDVSFRIANTLEVAPKNSPPGVC